MSRLPNSSAINRPETSQTISWSHRDDHVNRPIRKSLAESSEAPPKNKNVIVTRIETTFDIFPSLSKFIKNPTCFILEL